MSETAAPEPEKFRVAPPGWHISGIASGTVYTRVSGYTRKNLKNVPADGLKPKHLSTHGPSNRTAVRVDPIIWKGKGSKFVKTADAGYSGEPEKHPPFYEKYEDNLRKLAAIVEVCMRYLELNGKNVKFAPKATRMGYYEDEEMCTRWVTHTEFGEPFVSKKKYEVGKPRIADTSEKPGTMSAEGVVTYSNCVQKYHKPNSKHYTGRAFDRIIEISGRLDADVMFAHAAKLVLSGHIPDGGMGYYEEFDQSAASDFHYDYGEKRKWFWAGQGYRVNEDGKRSLIKNKKINSYSGLSLEEFIYQTLPERVTKRLNLNNLPDPKSFGNSLPTWEEIYNQTTEEESEHLVYLFEDINYDILSIYGLAPAEQPPAEALQKMKRRIVHSAAVAHNKEFSVFSENSQEFLDTMNNLEAQGIIGIADTNYNIDNGEYRVLVRIKKEEWDALPESSPGFLASGLFIEMPFDKVEERTNLLADRLQSVKDQLDKSDEIESWDGDLDKVIADIKRFPSLVKNYIFPKIQSAGPPEESKPLLTLVVGVGLKEAPETAEGVDYDVKFVGADYDSFAPIDGLEKRIDPPPVVVESSGDLADIKADASMISSTSLNFLAFHQNIISTSSPPEEWFEFLENWYVPETSVVWKPMDKGQVPGLKTDADVAKEDRALHNARIQIAQEGLA